MSFSTAPLGQDRLLVIGAHPDDNEVGCGATVAKLVQQGWEATYVVCTNGNKGSHDPHMSPHRLAEIREEEQQAAAKKLGVRHVIFLRYNDGEIELSPALRLEMALYIRHFRPRYIFTHDPWRAYMLHPDHRTIGFAVLEGVVNARDHLYVPGLNQIGISLWRPEYLFLWSPERADYTEDVSDTLDLKIEALYEHKSQIRETDNWIPRMRQRALQQGQEAGFHAGEAFKRIKL